MDLDKEFVASVLLGGEKTFQTAIDRGIGPDFHLFGDGKKAWTYILSHKKEYGSLPSKELIVQVSGADLTAGGADPFPVLLDEVFKRRLYNVCKDGSRDVASKLEIRDPHAAAEAFSEVHHKIRNENLTVSKVESLFSYANEVLQHYERVKAGMRGVRTPFPTMDDQTMGWWPEDLILFVGRMGVGKTFGLILSAYIAWRDAKKVLIISTEMSKKKIAMRAFAMHLKLPYEDMTHGRLGEFIEKKMRDGLAELVGEQGIGIVGGAFDFSIESVDAAIDESGADLICIDGAYLIKNKGKDRHERVSNTFDDFKRIGKTRLVPILATLQFNRSAKTANADTIDASNIGVTDVAGWNADAAYGMWATDDMLKEGKMGWKALKVREGKPGDFQSNWDITRMDFSEVGHSDIIPSASLQSGEQDDLGDVPF